MMGHWTTQASQLTGKRPANDEMEIAMQAIAELAKQCSELQSLTKHLEQQVNELRRRQN
jgi:hypothetical protein